MDQAWTQMLAAQAAGKDMEKWLKRWTPVLEADKELTGGISAFKARYGAGF